MAKHDIAKYNEDVDDACDYCLNDISTTPHTTWGCSLFSGIRIATDAELAKVPLKHLIYCIQCGIAPAMKADRKKTYWVLAFDEDTPNAVKALLGID